MSKFPPVHIEGNFVQDVDGSVWNDGDQRLGSTVTVLNEPVYFYKGLLFIKSQFPTIRIITNENHRLYGKAVRVIRTVKQGPFEMFQVITNEDRFSIMKTDTAKIGNI